MVREKEKKSTSISRPPVLPTAEQTFCLPDWHDGVLPDQGKSVLIVREVAYSTVCSAVVSEKMSIRDMLQDYVGLRAFEAHEQKVAITYEVVSNGQPVQPVERAIATRTGRRTTVRYAVQHVQWVRTVNHARCC
jgi:hypothetical protein